ncbi:hypothetical protein BDP27DRAFT_1361284 [Rhodocollybia butyracea]|uniref:Uncharacterized protein n=1 Tax=Rhodocollybia butyracea TaxID=206335 RepID=A0A9P5UAI0_9AGAR|nr:hypothetical protein BDP27DRAFT_1361284 [Rhodocollybia butyracea]
MTRLQLIYFCFYFCFWHLQVMSALLGSPQAACLVDKLAQYKTAAGFIYRSLNIFTNVALLFEHGLCSDGFNTNKINLFLDSSDDEGNGVEPEDDLGDLPIDEEYVKAYNVFLNLAPGLRDTMNRFMKDPKGLAKFITLMNHVAKADHGTDIARFKDCIHEYVLDNPNSDTLFPPLPDNSSKSNHGFYHEKLAVFIVPWAHYPAFKEDPKGFCTGIINKESDIKINNSSGIPMLMYDLELYNPQDCNTGWGKSKLLIRGLKHFLGSPKSVFCQPGSAKGSAPLHKIYNICSLTPSIIAYVAFLEYLNNNALPKANADEDNNNPDTNDGATNNEEHDLHDARKACEMQCKKEAAETVAAEKEATEKEGMEDGRAEKETDPCLKDFVPESPEA